jgi:2'-5' RNA ligase
MASMYFIALVAPNEINEQVLKWKQLTKDRFGCIVALRSPAHITLVPPFWMDQPLETQLQTAISNFSLQQNSLDVTLKDFGAFKPRVIYVDVLENNSLQMLHDRLLQLLISLDTFPIEKEDRTFHPHVTIATRDLHKKSFREAWEVFKEKKYDATWLVNSISLLRHNQKNWDVIFTSQFSN